MFFRCRRRRPSLLSLLLLLFGFKIVVEKERLSDEERDEYRTKAKTFRRKLREAFAVWDDEEQTQTASADDRS